MEKVQLKFTVLSTSESTPLGFEVWLDSNKIYDHESFVGETTLTVDVDEDGNEHVFKFVLKNKQPFHTKINDAGEIISDTRLKIEDISFDNIRLTHDMLQLIKYIHDFNGTSERQEHKFYGEIGCNGFLELKFTTPIYLWILENM